MSKKYPIYDLLDQFSKSDLKKFNHLAKKHGISIYQLSKASSDYSLRKVIEEGANSKHNGAYKNNSKEMLEIYELADKYNISEANIERLWLLINAKFRAVHQQYKKMPKNKRQDNKDYINRGNRNGYNRDIRFPSKKRSKACWKRFYKLFPHLDPKNKNKNK